MDKKTDGNKDGNFQWKQATRTILFWVLLFFGAVAIVQIFNLRKEKEIKVDFSEYRQFIEKKAVEKALIEEKVFHGILKYEESLVRNNEVIKVRRFKTTLLVIDREILEEWESLGIRLEFKLKTAEWWSYLIWTWPILLIVFFWGNIQFWKKQSKAYK